MMAKNNPRTRNTSGVLKWSCAWVGPCPDSHYCASDIKRSFTAKCLYSQIGRRSKSEDLIPSKLYFYLLQNQTSPATDLPPSQENNKMFSIAGLDLKSLEFEIADEPVHQPYLASLSESPHHLSDVWKPTSVMDVWQIPESVSRMGSAIYMTPWTDQLPYFRSYQRQFLEKHSSTTIEWYGSHPTILRCGAVGQQPYSA